MAMEGLPLHFTLFSKIWSEIYNKSHEVVYINYILTEVYNIGEAPHSVGSMVAQLF